MIKRRLGGRELRARVLAALRLEDRDQALAVLAELPARQVVNPLFSFLCGSDPTVRWRAVTAMGATVAKLASEDMEAARVIMRRMIWQLNDESGGIGWGLPEAMGESMARHEGLAQEYAHLLASYVREDGNFLEHVPLQQGVLWGVGRLAQTWPSLVEEAIPHVERFLDADDATLRGLAAWIMGILRVQSARGRLESLTTDGAEAVLYQEWRGLPGTVGELARQALAAVKETPG
jgi:hypothetical protein